MPLKASTSFSAASLGSAAAKAPRRPPAPARVVALAKGVRGHLRAHLLDALIQAGLYSASMRASSSASTERGPRASSPAETGSSAAEMNARPRMADSSGYLRHALAGLELRTTWSRGISTVTMFCPRDAGAGCACHRACSASDARSLMTTSSIRTSPGSAFLSCPSRLPAQTSVSLAAAADDLAFGLETLGDVDDLCCAVRRR